MSAKLRVVSWVLLTLVGGLTLLGSLGSVYVAYVADAEQDQIGPMKLSELAKESAAHRCRNQLELDEPELIFRAPGPRQRRR